MKMEKPAPPRVRSEFVRWLDQYEFDRYVTLAINDPMKSTPGAVELLKEWDARMNRRAAGPLWLKRPDEALWSFYFLEKADRNPHWHCLIRFMTFYPELTRRQARAVDKFSEPTWRRICPGGSVDVQVIEEQRRVKEYVVKSLDNMVAYERFVVPDEFRRHP